MEKYNQCIDFKSIYENIVVVLGMFDGIHIGHQKIIHTAVMKAHEIKGTAVVFSFVNHPRSVIDPEHSPKRIGNESLRYRILKNLGVDALVEIPFTEDFSKTSADDFTRFLFHSFAPKYIVIGENYSFGYRGSGTPDLLRMQEKIYGFQLIECTSVVYDGVPVSSTRIRKAIENGALYDVNQCLGYPFAILGKVIHGQSRGRQLGFPTANIFLHEDYEMLPNGIYAVTVLYQKCIYHGVANIGNNPTFDGCDRRLEVHVIDFSGNLYESEITVFFYEKIRAEQKFDSVDALIMQIQKDKDTALKVLGETFHLQANISMVI